MEYAAYKKNDIVTVTIEDVGNDGEGIGKAEGYTLFVKDAVIGDTVEARITKCKKNYGYARAEKVVTPSSFRVEPKCKFHRQCGGCQIQAMSYARQLIFKQEKVRNNLIRIGGFAEDVIDKIMEPIVGMEEPWHYRNKAQYPVGYDKKGNLVVGFYAGRTHDIIANTDCALGAKENKEILEAVLSYMRENQVTAYREADGTGLVRHVLIRTGFASGQITVCLVINGKKLPAENKLIEKLRRLELSRRGSTDYGVSGGCLQESGDVLAEGEQEYVRSKTAKRRIVSIAVSVNEERTNVIMGKEIRVLWGSEQIEDSLRILKAVQDKDRGNIESETARSDIPDIVISVTGSRFIETGEHITFQISPLSFYQVNPKQTEKLYSLALDYAGLTGEETVWDLYCGIGTISLFMAKKAKQVYGVEVIPQAVEDAQENTRINGIGNVQFYVGKAEEVLPAFYEQNDSYMRHPDVIVVDPPRKGCDERCLETMLAVQPERIVYVSCDSATLARDLRILAEGGYELKKVRAVDQFGHSVHVETVVALGREFSRDVEYAYLDYEPRKNAQFTEGATYSKIKDWILEQYGLKVSSFYVAQIKDKCGIREYEAHNHGKGEHHVPNCPPEKEEAIRAAFKHFNMI